MEKKPFIMFNIDMNYLIKECAIDVDKELKRYDNLNRKYQDYLFKNFNYKVFDEHFTSNALVWGFADGVDNMALSYPEYLEKLQYLLNIKDVTSVDGDELDKEFNNKLNNLANVKSIKNLKFNFPALYDIYERGNDFIATTNAMEQYAWCEPVYPELINKSKTYKNYADRCGISDQLSTFVEKQYNGLSKLVNNRSDVRKFIVNNKFDSNNFDLDKLRLVIAYEIICSSVDISKSDDIKDFIINVISDDKYNGYVIHDKEGNEVSFDAIKINGEKRINGEGLDISVLPWITIPKGKNPTSKKITSIKKGKGFSKDSYIKNIEKNQKKRDYKLSIYEATPYIFRTLGVGMFDGYMAYGYENGNVIADTIPTDHNLSMVNNNAIYVFDSSNFLLMSMKNKQELKDEESVIKLNHAGDWVKRVMDYANADVLDENKEQAMILKRTIDGLK